MKNIVKMALYIALFTSLCGIVSITVEAKDVNEKGKLYTYSDQNSHYEVDGYKDVILSTENNQTLGVLTISGDVSEKGKEAGFDAYEINSGSVVISYELTEDSFLIANEEEWHIREDIAKEINGKTFEEMLGKGAIVIQASMDGEKWVTEKSIMNILELEDYSAAIYETQDIQQYNGCYFRILVVYEMERKSGDGLFNLLGEYEHKKCAEVYSFYLEDAQGNSSLYIDPNATPQKVLGSKVNAGHDSGYSQENALEQDDPHYGWDIGYFYVNGYTRETVDSATNAPCFLKNVGDRVTLWFHLSEDIDCLNGREDLYVAEDTNGYDKQFEVAKTNMHRGTLIIRYTDYEGVSHDPVIYTNYLAANARTGANTRVELFEEGNYEVALDYELVTDGILDTFSNYRIYFTFEIRNGNCMVYPFDINSGAELSDKAITENGFKLDMARSRYLTIDVQKSVVNLNSDGTLSEDIRFNKPAKDGDSYTDEGIYTFSVNNLFTGETTQKTIYVGNSDYLLALSKSGFTIDEMNLKLGSGYHIETQGILVSDEVELTDEIVMPVQESIDLHEEKQMIEVKDEIDVENKKEGLDSLVVCASIGIGIGVVILIIVLICRKQKQRIIDANQNNKNEN